MSKICNFLSTDDAAGDWPLIISAKKSSGAKKHRERPSRHFCKAKDAQSILLESPCPMLTYWNKASINFNFRKLQLNLWLKIASGLPFPLFVSLCIIIYYFGWRRAESVRSTCKAQVTVDWYLRLSGFPFCIHCTVAGGLAYVTQRMMTSSPTLTLTSRGWFSTDSNRGPATIQCDIVHCRMSTITAVTPAKDRLRTEKYIVNVST